MRQTAEGGRKKRLKTPIVCARGERVKRRGSGRCHEREASELLEATAQRNPELLRRNRKRRENSVDLYVCAPALPLSPFLAGGKLPELFSYSDQISFSGASHFPSIFPFPDPAGPRLLNSFPTTNEL